VGDRVTVVQAGRAVPLRRPQLVDLVMALAIATTLGLSGTPWWAGDHYLRRLRRTRTRGALRVLLALGTVVLARLLLPVSVGRAGSGTWVCVVCGKMEEQSAFLGILVFRTEPETSPRSIEIARTYSAWFGRAVETVHSHAWMPTGCHGVGLSIACSSTVEQHVYFSFLPVVPAQDVAVALVDRMSRADERERRALLRAMNISHDQSPFVELLSGEELTVPEFRRAFDVWLAENPIWSPRDA